LSRRSAARSNPHEVPLRYLLLPLYLLLSLLLYVLSLPLYSSQKE